MPGATDLQGPVGYSSVWTLLAVAAVAVTLVYYAAVLWATRITRATRTRRTRSARPLADRQVHLRRIDEVEAAVRSGSLPATTGHQRLSETVRGYVQASGHLPAASMTLESSRGTAPELLTDLLAEIYPPAFAGDEDAARDRFDAACRRAREVVTTWT